MDICIGALDDFRVLALLREHLTQWQGSNSCYRVRMSVLTTVLAMASSGEFTRTVC